MWIEQETEERKRVSRKVQAKDDDVLFSYRGVRDT